MESWWRTLLILVLVPNSTLLYMQLKSIKLIIESICILARALHWIVAQHIQSEVAARERAPLRVVDRDVELDVEFM